MVTYRRFVFAIALLTTTPLWASDTDKVTYTEDVAPVLYKHCVSCHRPGQIAPMSLLSYEETRPWAKAIRREVSARTMPPFYADAPKGHFRGDPRLTDQDRDAVERWADLGAPRGPRAPLPPLEIDTNSEWKLGTPDVVIEFTISQVTLRSGPENFYYVFSDNVIPRDMWLRGVELQNDRLDILHHANVFHAYESERNESGLRESRTFADKSAGRGMPLLLWLPGSEPQPYGDGVAIRAIGQRKLVLDVHYAGPRMRFDDRVRIGLFEAKDGVAFERKIVGVPIEYAVANLKIEPEDPAFRLSYTHTLQNDLMLTGFGAHMHYRGRSVGIDFQYPDGRSERVFSIPSWNPDWQREYLLHDATVVPAGTTVTYSSVWDNSDTNPFNPNPKQRVSYGTTSRQEMWNVSLYHNVPIAESQPQSPPD